MDQRKPTDTDRLVGQRVRLARRMAKLSQTQLGLEIGVTYQQVQKYENGTDRINAGRLYQVAQVTDQPISFFFGLADAGVEDVLADPAIQKIIAAAARVRNPGLLFNLAGIAETFAASEKFERHQHETG